MDEVGNKVLWVNIAGDFARPLCGLRIPAGGGVEHFTAGGLRPPWLLSVVRQHTSQLEAGARTKKAGRLAPSCEMFVEHRGFEPLTYRLRTYRSTN